MMARSEETIAHILYSEDHVTTPRSISNASPKPSRTRNYVAIFSIAVIIPNYFDYILIHSIPGHKKRFAYTIKNCFLSFFVVVVVFAMPPG